MFRHYNRWTQVERREILIYFQHGGFLLQTWRAFQKASTINNVKWTVRHRRNGR